MDWILYFTGRASFDSKDSDDNNFNVASYREFEGSVPVVTQAENVECAVAEMAERLTVAESEVDAASNTYTLNILLDGDLISSLQLHVDEHLGKLPDLKGVELVKESFELNDTNVYFTLDSIEE
jgi:hypothetical protein